MKKLPERKKDISKTISEDIPNEKKEIPKSSRQGIKQTSEKHYIDKKLMMRDNFSKVTKEILAKRVSFKCSNPNCKKNNYWSSFY